MKEKIKRKETGTSHAGLEPAHQLPPAGSSATSDHWAMRPLHQKKGKINNVEVFFFAIHAV